MSYSILAINPGHNGSVALVIDGELVYYCEEERVSRMKYDGNPFRAMTLILNSFKVDELVIGGTTNILPTVGWTGENVFTSFVRKYYPAVKTTILGNLHHLGHAASAFYGSGFDTAVAIVVDGAGSLHQEKMDEEGKSTAGYETESIYHCSYPHEFDALYKRYSNDNCLYYNNGIQEFDSSVTITKAYEAVTFYLGFGFIEAGKTMGLSPYGKEDETIPDFFVAGKGNKNLLLPYYPGGAFIDEDRFTDLKRVYNPKDWHNDLSLLRDIDKNLAYKIQKQAEEQMFDLIQKALDISGENNVVISGGFGLNCVANYKYLKKFPGINFYIDPIAHDGGTSIGLAKYAWHLYSLNTEPKEQKSIYLGNATNYIELNNIINDLNNDISLNLIDAAPVVVIDATSDDITNLLIDGNIVSMFQGQAEAGPRALGNRSILFDPRISNGKDIVNTVKKREWFRPFAGSVMEEHAKDWFDMATLKSSPFMMYAVDVLPEKAHLIPSVTHVDNTCRVQTVNKSQNKNYYDLLESFYKKTEVPLLFNTSFNLAGEPLVDTLLDAITTIMRCEINYLYLPDIGKLVRKIQ